MKKFKLQDHIQHHKTGRKIKSMLQTWTNREDMIGLGVKSLEINRLDFPG